MMENLHIRLNPDETIASKKRILSAEINLLNILKKIQIYKDLRKLEFAKRAALKARLNEAALGMKKLKADIPSARIPQIEEASEVKMEKTTAIKLEEELEEIREKLAKLS